MLEFLRGAISYFFEEILAPRFRRDTETTFPKDAFVYYEISQNEFSRIAMKIAYRHPRIESVDIDENLMSLEINSQSGLSTSHAKLVFELNGYSIGAYRIGCDNPDTIIPDKIADRIQTEIRKYVEFRAT